MTRRDLHCLLEKVQNALKKNAMINSQSNGVVEAKVHIAIVIRMMLGASYLDHCSFGI